MIDKNKIFNLFMEGTEIKDEKTKKEIKKFMEGPFAKLGMFVKLIQNHQVFHQKLEKFLKHEKPNFNPSKTKEASEYSIYNKSWEYISQIDLSHHDDVNAIINFDPKLLYSTLGMSIKYFEEIEEYEKCSHLHNIQEIVRRI
tara:strand:- start:647 stop:1072 length:426 start_codon:yes stop_codon:yes gene_type:complete